MPAVKSQLTRSQVTSCERIIFIHSNLRSECFRSSRVWRYQKPQLARKRQHPKMAGILAPVHSHPQRFQSETTADCPPSRSRCPRPRGVQLRVLAVPNLERWIFKKSSVANVVIKTCKQKKTGKKKKKTLYISHV